MARQTTSQRRSPVRPPFGCSQCTAANFPPPGSTYSFTFSNSPAPGNFDLLAGCDGNSSSALAQCFTCAQTYSLPDLTPLPPDPSCSATPPLCLGSADGATGSKFNSNPVDTAIQTLFGKVVLVPIYLSASGQGNNAVYDIGGFAAFLIQSWDKKTAILGGTFERFVSVADEGTCTGTGGNFGAQTYYLVG